MIEIKIGDCVDHLKHLEDNSVDAIICDPPDGLKFMSKRWDNIGDGAEQREWHRAWLTEAYRVLKPNGVLKAFSGTRTYHHLIAMMGELNFNELSVEAWVFGSGFPKSLNVSKQFAKSQSNSISDQSKWEGWGTTLKPAWEVICVGIKK